MVVRGFIFVLCILPLSALGNEWKVEKREAGIEVSVQEVPNRGLPIFRGIGLVQAPIEDVLPVLSDTPRRVEWVHACTASKILAQVTPHSRIVYNRTASPWPVSDRDMVVRTEVKIDPKGKEVWIPFKEAPEFGHPEQDGVVRVPRIRGHYRIRAVSETQTEVTYQVDADPGGMLPQWLARMASVDLPLKTLMGLRRQVAKTQKSALYMTLRTKWRNALTPKDTRPQEP